MRYLVLTDIHANLEALDTCLADALERGYDRTLVLGDIVGYGADPNAVIERVQRLDPVAMVRGNHDKVACGLEQPEGFNIAAKTAALWTFDALTPEHRAWLAALPKGPGLVDPVIEICHGSPFDEDVYIFDEASALRALKASRRQLCLYGHTHYQIVWQQSIDAADGLETIGRSPAREIEIPLRDRFKYFLNPGAVGQPRDGDPRAGYAIVDVERGLVEQIRLPYPVELAQAKVIGAGLPDVLAQRLAVGR
jgi:predicted phosphodiesterase